MDRKVNLRKKKPQEELWGNEYFSVNVVTEELLKILKDKSWPDPYPRIRAAELLMQYINSEK